MNRPLEPVRLDDPPRDRRVGEVHPAPTPAQENPIKQMGKFTPTPVPLTFAQTFGAVFLAILAAALVIGLVNAVINAVTEHKRQEKEINELLQRR